jgi:hypothetical protein
MFGAYYFGQPYFSQGPNLTLEVILVRYMIHIRASIRDRVEVQAAVRPRIDVKANI